ncbi:glycosyltransferase family 4 protein [Mesotoga sp.]|uniref:glycosyltransferase family 4 protein n=1 Tax=Mesotoga sp. TaxID=2053577 RepID=UPI00345E87E0
MKVALVSSDNSSIVRQGGKHVYQSLLEKYLLQRQISVKTFYPGPSHYQITTRRGLTLAFKYGLIRFWDPFERSRVKIADLRSYFRKLDLKDEDVVHCQDVVSASSVECSNNTVLTVHGYFAYESLARNFRGKESERESAAKRLLEIEEEAFGKSCHIICVDKERQNYVVEKFKIPLNRITVLHNAVDTENFFPVSDEQKRSIREQLGLPVDKTTVLIASRFSPEKGISYAVKAASMMKNNRDVFFVFVGGGPERESIDSVAEGLENIIILDSVPHDRLSAFFKATDIVLVPSITYNNVREGTSMSLLEGMACGKIVVASRVGGMAELIEDGHNGFFVEEGSVDAIYSKLVELSNRISDYSVVGKSAHKTVLEKHTFAKYVDRLINIYNSCLMQTSKPEKQASF